MHCGLDNDDDNDNDDNDNDDDDDNNNNNNNNTAITTISSFNIGKCKPCVMRCTMQHYSSGFTADFRYVRFNSL